MQARLRGIGTAHVGRTSSGSSGGVEGLLSSGKLGTSAGLTVAVDLYQPGPEALNSRKGG